MWALSISSLAHALFFLVYFAAPFYPAPNPIWIEKGGAPESKSAAQASDHRQVARQKSVDGETGTSAFVGQAGNAVHSTVEQWTVWGNAPPEYPYQAQRKGWEGKVEVRIAVAPHQGSRVTLEKSSGHSVLDEAALDWARKARVTVSRETEYLVPIEFRLAN